MYFSVKIGHKVVRKNKRHIFGILACLRISKLFIHLAEAIGKFSQ